MTAERHTEEGDLVLIQTDGKAAGFARVDGIRPHDLDGWFHCDLLLLAVPPRPITWILERAQIDGLDFTMSGQPIRLERLPGVGSAHEAARAAETSDGSAPPPDGSQSDSKEGSGKVVELFPAGRSGAD